MRKGSEMPSIITPGQTHGTRGLPRNRIRMFAGFTDNHKRFPKAFTWFAGVTVSATESESLTDKREGGVGVYRLLCLLLLVLAML